MSLQAPHCRLCSKSQLDGAAALERGNVAIRSEADRIPKSDRILNSQLALECAQRRGGVVGPVTPCRSCESVLRTCQTGHEQIQPKCVSSGAHGQPPAMKDSTTVEAFQPKQKTFNSECKEIRCPTASNTNQKKPSDYQASEVLAHRRIHHIWIWSWKNMPMMAIMASLPLASSADNFFVFSAGSDEVSTLKP